jgi:hypothetical protein
MGTFTKRGLAELPEAVTAAGPDISLDELVSMMAGGRELAELSHELRQQVDR